MCFMLGKLLVALLVCFIAVLLFGFLPLCVESGNNVDLPPITAANASQIEEVARLGNGSVDQLLWAPNGQYVAAFGASGTWLFDRDNLAEPQMHIQTHSDRIEYAAFSPDSRLVATGGDDAVSIIVVETGELLRTLETARDFVAFSPDGNWIITDSQRAADSPMVWSVSRGK
jgi:WD40 repeat protein